MLGTRGRAGWRLGAWLMLCVVGIAGCGGGGGDDGGGKKRPVSVVFAPPSLSATSIEGFATTVEMYAQVDPGGHDPVYLGLEDPGDVVADADVTVGPSGLTATLTLSATKPAGVHTTQVRLLACADPDCARPLPGSPFLLPLRYEVLPQLRIATPQPMRRVGREVAPSQSLPLTLPPDAGNISLSLVGVNTGSAFNVAIEGQQLRVSTTQLPAGTYRARVELRGSADTRYFAAADLEYVVEPPAGGERPLQVTPNHFELQAVQGTVSTHRFRIDRPTWTDALDPVVLTRSDGGIVRDLRPLGNDEYEFTVDTSGLSPGGTPGMAQNGYYALIPVRAGEFGGQSGVSVNVVVGAPLTLGLSSHDLTLTARSPATELARSMTVSAADGAAVTWRASSDQPWLQLTRTSGVTGTDELAYRIDPSVTDLPGWQQGATLSVSVDRPGTLPVNVPVIVQNLLPRIDMAAPGVLTGPTAKVHLHGWLWRETDVLSAGVLGVEGATLQSAVIEEDSRFVGSMGVLALTLTDIVPGRAVTVRTNSLLRPDSVSLPSVGPVRVPLGHAVLPRGDWRVPGFAAQGRALIFAGPGAVWRWPLGDGGWGAPRSQAVPGLIDVSPASDESDLFAVTADTALALDPVTLQTRREGRIALQDTLIDARIPAFSRALVHAADGRAFASRRSGAGTTYEGQSIGWLSGCPSRGEVSVDLTVTPCFADPGTNWLYDPGASPGGVPLVRSQEGQAVAHVFSNGAAVVYRGLQAQRSALPALPAGRSLVAIDDAGRLLVRDDGVMVRADGSTVDLKALLPQGFVAGAWALRGDGAVVAVYAYRIVSEAGGPRARDAALLFFGTPGSDGAALRGQVVLPDAVGCNAPLAADESCTHAGALQFAAGGESLFLIGPRGVAAAPAPVLTVPAGASKRTLMHGPAKRLPAR